MNEPRPPRRLRGILTTGDGRYAWLNTSFGVLEGVLDSVGAGGVARGRLYVCRPTIS